MNAHDVATDPTLDRLFAEAATAFAPPSGLKDEIRRRMFHTVAAPPAAVRRPTPLPMPQRRASRHLWIGVAAAAVLLAGLAVAWYSTVEVQTSRQVKEKFDGAGTNQVAVTPKDAGKRVIDLGP
jgi:hypothetical protein